MCAPCIAKIEPLSAEYFCSVCRTPFVSGSSLDESGRCAQCLDGTRGFDAAYCFGRYDGDLRNLIHLFKYARMRTLERPLGRLLTAALPRDERFDAIVPVPMHWRRRWNRGFNQAERLARSVARRSGLPLWHGLRRTRRTPAQAGLTLAERRVNIATAFQVARDPAARQQISGKRVLLVDDVFTTGATASACAQALKDAGAASVVLLTLARVDRRWAEVPAGNSLQEQSS